MKKDTLTALAVLAGLWWLSRGSSASPDEKIPGADKTAKTVFVLKGQTYLVLMPNEKSRSVLDFFKKRGHFTSDAPHTAEEFIRQAGIPIIPQWQKYFGVYSAIFVEFQKDDSFQVSPDIILERIN